MPTGIPTTNGKCISSISNPGDHEYSKNDVDESQNQGESGESQDEEHDIHVASAEI
jgi:hypothetical protein